MGGDDSQKLLPWRGLHSSPGRKPPAPLRNQHSNPKGWSEYLRLSACSERQN
jgi:hypothetical protein